jgi:hypothetical protein
MPSLQEEHQQPLPVPKTTTSTSAATTTMNNDSILQAKCAAGSLCKAPDDAKQEESTHYCFECRGKIHCAMWCGHILSEIKITTDQLSSAGRASFQSSDHDLLSICMVCIIQLSTSSDTTTTTGTASLKRKGSEILADHDLSSLLKEAKQTTCEDTTADGKNTEAEKEDIDWKLVSPSTCCVAKWWKYYKKFNSVAHPSMKDYAACTLCFVVGKFAKGTISIKGGGTGGIRRHLLNNHTSEFEILDAGKKPVVGGDNSIVNHFKPWGKEMSLEDIRLLFVMAAASWAILEAVPFKMFASPSFWRMFEPLNKDLSKIVNVGQL